MNIKGCNSEKIYIISLLTVYISFIPGLGETQPILFFLFGCFSILCWWIGINIKTKITKNELIYFFIFLMFFCYSILILLISEANSVVFVKYLIAISVSIGVFQLFRNIKIWHGFIYYVPLFLLILALVQIAKIPLLYDSISYVFGFLMPRALTSSVIEGRGVTLLSPEQSYSALMVASLMITIDIFYLYNPKEKLKYAASIFSCMVLLVLVNALIGFIFLITYIITKFFKIKQLVYLFPFLLVMFFLIKDNSRIISIINAFDLIANVSDVLEILSSIEPSGTTRILLTIANVKSGLDWHFGCGPGFARESWGESLNSLGMYFESRHEVLGEQFLNNTPTETQTLLLGIIGDYGVILFVLVIGFTLLRFNLIRTFFDRKYAFSWVCILIAAFYQSGITAPYTAIFICSLLHHNKFTD